MMHHKAPHRNQAAPSQYLGMFENKTFSLPETYFDDYSTRCPASIRADNKVKNQYWSNDLKLNLPNNMSDPGTGGGAEIGFDPIQAYENFLARMNEEQLQKWNDFYKPISDAFFQGGVPQPSQALDIDIYQRFMRDYMQSVAAVDDSVGEILDYLEESGQINNTLIVYTAD